MELSRITSSVSRRMKASIAFLRSPFSTSEFSIRRGYFHRKKYFHFSDVDFTDEWQKEVYELAESAARENGYTKILDAGCDSGLNC